MGKPVTHVVYKPDSQSTETFSVIVYPEELQKWKAGDKTIPLVEVVDSFDIFHSEQGSQGYLGRASKQQLDSVFGTHNDDEVVKAILEMGDVQSTDLDRYTRSNKNLAQGGPIIDVRGSAHGTSGTGAGHGGGR